MLTTSSSDSGVGKHGSKSLALCQVRALPSQQHSLPQAHRLQGEWTAAAQLDRHRDVQGGDVQTPGRGSMFYLSQRPYLVAGSLRDQLTYPFPPANVAGELGRRDAGCFEHLPSRTVPPDELDARLEAALEAVELEYLLGRCAT